ncbi:histidine kinase [Chitinophaga sp.]|uniref:sensor histidine kinase n=1 Tax=Chitinophaga sp. TaxID=1869181 RepID=UPI0031D01935
MHTIRKAELWLASGLYLMMLFAILYPTLFHESEPFAYGYHVERLFEDNHMAFDNFTHFIMPKVLIATLVYLSFVSVNQQIVPAFMEQRKYVAGILQLAAVALGFFTFVMVAYSYRYGYMLGYKTVGNFHDWCAGRAFVTTIVMAAAYALYYGAKYLYFRFLHAQFTEWQVWKKVTVEIVLMLAAWVVWLVMLTQDNRYAAFSAVFWTGLNYLMVYIILYYFIFPPYHRKEQRWPLLWRNLLLIMIFFCGLSTIIIATTTRINDMSVVVTVTIFGEVLFVLPLAFILSRIRMKQKNEVLNLEKALGRSSANLDFLRSQINPHFLFNALNTLYGTALQENAPRTSEGVQKLGDMMRFMLHENHQEKIELSKEVGYLQNYISLQRLRTQASPDIKIEVNIREEHCDHFIAPMLLIPFVENAFKHGISLRSRSWIVVSLSCSQRHIYFDAYNSVHPKLENDPEKASLGIGLNNVRRRLALLYPGKHELSIRETNTEFFVHLTIDTQ